MMAFQTYQLTLECEQEGVRVSETLEYQWLVVKAKPGMPFNKPQRMQQERLERNRNKFELLIKETYEKLQSKGLTTQHIKEIIKKPEFVAIENFPEFVRKVAEFLFRYFDSLTAWSIEDFMEIFNDMKSTDDWERFESCYVFLRSKWFSVGQVKEVISSKFRDLWKLEQLYKVGINKNYDYKQLIVISGAPFAFELKELPSIIETHTAENVYACICQNLSSSLTLDGLSRLLNHHQQKVHLLQQEAQLEKEQQQTLQELQQLQQQIQEQVRLNLRQQLFGFRLPLSSVLQAAGEEELRVLNQGQEVGLLEAPAQDLMNCDADVRNQPEEAESNKTKNREENFLLKHGFYDSLDDEKSMSVEIFKRKLERKAKDNSAPDVSDKRKSNGDIHSSTSKRLRNNAGQAVSQPHRKLITDFKNTLNNLNIGRYGDEFDRLPIAEPGAVSYLNDKNMRKYQFQNVMRDSASTQTVSSIAIKTDLLTCEFYSHSRQSVRGDRVTFVFAGRGKDALAPVEEAGGRVILIMAEADLKEIAEHDLVKEYQDLIIIKDLKMPSVSDPNQLNSIDRAQIGYITARRLVCFLLMRHFNLTEYFFALDDNIAEVAFNASQISTDVNSPLRWRDIYDSMVVYAKQREVSCLSMRELRPFYHASLLEVDGHHHDNNREGLGLGSKFFLLNAGAFSKELFPTEAALSQLLPPFLNVYSEDFFFQLMMTFFDLNIDNLPVAVSVFKRSYFHKNKVRESLKNNRVDWVDVRSEHLHQGFQQFALVFFQLLAKNNLDKHKAAAKKIQTVDLFKLHRQINNSLLENANNETRPGELCHWQISALDAMSKAQPGEPHCIEMATGSGKTFVFLTYLANALSSSVDAESTGNKFIIVPTVQLVKQMYEYVIRFNQMFPNTIDIDRVIKISSAPNDINEVFLQKNKNMFSTYTNKLFIICEPSFVKMRQNGTLQSLLGCKPIIILDEVHELSSRARNFCLELLQKDKANVFGFSATLGAGIARDGEGLRRIYRFGIQDARKNNAVSHWAVREFTNVFPRNNVEFNHLIQSLPKMLQNYQHPMGGACINHKTVIYVSDAEKVKACVDSFNKHAGLTIAASYISHNDDDVNEEAFAKFNDPSLSLRVLVSIRMIGVGTNMVTPTIMIDLTSAINRDLNIQRLGRVIRLDYTNPDKVALALVFEGYDLGKIKFTSVDDVTLLGENAQENYQYFMKQTPPQIDQGFSLNGLSMWTVRPSPQQDSHSIRNNNNYYYN